MMNNVNVSKVFFGASLASIAASIFIWNFSGGDPAHAERFALFVGLWAPTMMGLSNYYKG